MRKREKCEGARHERPAGGNSTRIERATRGWSRTTAEREVSKEEQQHERRAVDATIRTGRVRGETSDERERRPDEVRDRADADERAGKNRGEKERRAHGKERRNEISRGRKRVREGESGRTREREGARRRGRRRERDSRICVLKQTFDQSADCCQSYVAAAYPSVPVAGPRIQFRVFTRRGNQDLVRARGYPRKPRVKSVASRWLTIVCAS